MKSQKIPLQNQNRLCRCRTLLAKGAQKSAVEVTVGKNFI